MAVSAPTDLEDLFDPVRRGMVMIYRFGVTNKAAAKLRNRIGRRGGEISLRVLPSGSLDFNINDFTHKGP